VEYLSLQNEKSKESQQTGWIEQMKNIKEDDNPILVLINIKKSLP
jgi:hypothetical protein